MNAKTATILTRRSTGLLLATCALGAAFSSPAMGAEATAAVSVQAHLSSRTALTVSSQQLHFDVTSPSSAETASIDFSAAARTHGGVDVVLSVELLDASDRGASARTLTFIGEGEGTHRGALDSTRAFVAARWSGSGHRTGRFVFVLSASEAGTYTIPIRFVLTAP